MTIGIVLSKTPGYSETFFNSKIKGLQKQGFKVILYTQKSENNFNLCKVKNSLRLPQQSEFGFLKDLINYIIIVLSNFRIFRKFYRAEIIDRRSSWVALKSTYFNAHILKEKLDWLHFGFASMAIGKENIAKSIDAKMAVSLRGFDINIFPLKYPNCYNLLWEKVDKVHSISNYLMKKAYDLGLNPLVEKQIITPCVTIPSIAKSTNDNSQKIKIVTIARLNWIKGLDDAIQAMHILKEQSIAFEYHIIGDGTTLENERYRYHQHIKGLHNDIKFHGKLSHAESINILNDATIYLQSSINEGFCNAVLEAQALGKLCVVTNVGGLPENIVDKETGWLVPERDANGIANKIKEIIEMPETVKQQISENAKERVKKLFTCAQQQKKFVDFYSK